MRVIEGDCLDVMMSMVMDGEQVDSVVTDPPYHLTSTVKRFGSDTAAPAKSNGASGVYARASVGFMGQKWDGGDIAFRKETWELAYTLLKPGGYLLAFSGTRTYHRMACAIEDAGFEMRDMIAWVTGQGFPKNHDAGDGWGTALKPALEPIAMARKPLIGTVAQNVAAHGAGAINIDGCRVPTEGRPSLVLDAKDTDSSVYAGRVRGDAGFRGGSRAVGETNLGRWPANLIHDGSDEVLAAFPQAVSARASGNPNNPRHGSKNRVATSYDWNPERESHDYRDTGSAARFFYCAKTPKSERGGSKHPTVKPLALMRYLCRLVTPVGGTVLDPFAGSGSTLEAALLEGFDPVGIEQSPEFCADINARLIRASM